MRLSKLTIFFIIIIITITIATSGAFSSPSSWNLVLAQTNNNNSTDINQQIQSLQQKQSELQAQEQKLQQQRQAIADQAKQVAAQQEIARKNTLSTVGFIKPSLSSAAYDALKHCNPDQAMPVPDFNDSKYNNWWKTYLTDFHCGHVIKRFANNNTALREFTLIADDDQGLGRYIKISKNSSDPILFPAWTFNGTVPAPTLRMTAGDHVKVTVINSNNSKFAHSWHTHSIHSGPMDGVTGAAGSIPPGGQFTYEFIAAPFGVYPYHCHMSPVEQHIQRGLYGMMIIDPPTPRPPAQEMVMIMNGFSFNQINLVNPSDASPAMLVPPNAQQLREATSDFGMPEKKSDSAGAGGGGGAENPSAANNDNNGNANNNNNNRQGAAAAAQEEAAAAEERHNKIKEEALDPGGGESGNDNQAYAVNSMMFGYTGKDMIHLTTNQTYRIYLVNMVEFDPVNSFHLHANMFWYYPSGTSMKPDYLNDIVILGQGDRAILQFKPPLGGDDMFHAHINRFTDLGWMGMFHITTTS